MCGVMKFFFFFFKQKTAYEMLRSLVGSEMCIRDRPCSASRRETKFSPPRTLNAPVGVWFSCLTHTSVPVARARSGQAYEGVVGTYFATSRLVSARVSGVIDMTAKVPSQALSGHTPGARLGT